MFIPTITPEGIAREIVSRMIGDRAVAMNDMFNVFRDLPAMQHLMNILINPVPGQLITNHELNSAMSELLTAYNRNTDNNPCLNPSQKGAAKVANLVFVSMVHDSILSRLKIVSIKSE